MAPTNDDLRLMLGLSEVTDRLTFAVAGFAYGTPSDQLAATEAEMIAAGRAMALQFEELGAGVTEFELRVVRVPPDERRRRAAFHGAGHAVAAVLTGIDIKGLSLDMPASPADEALELGVAPSLILDHAPPRDEATRTRLEPGALRLALMLLAGTAGELLSDPYSSPAGSGDDIRQARRLCSQFAPPGKSEHAFARAIRGAAFLVRSAEPAVLEVARALKLGGTLSPAEIDSAATHALGGRRAVLEQFFSASVSLGEEAA